MTNSPPWDHPAYAPITANFKAPATEAPNVDGWYEEIKFKFVKTPLGWQFATIPRHDLPAHTIKHLPMDNVSMIRTSAWVPRVMLTDNPELWEQLFLQILDAVDYKSREIGLLRITDLTTWVWAPTGKRGLITGELEIISACLVVPPVKIEHIR